MNEHVFCDAIQKMTERRTVRDFSEKHISDEILEKILRAGIHAASGGNLQPYSVIVERDKGGSQRLSKILKYPFIGKADVNLLFLLDWCR